MPTFSRVHMILLVVRLWLLIIILSAVNVDAAPIIADHRAAQEFDRIPLSYLDKARAEHRIAYGHTSHGSQIVTGMQQLQTAFGAHYAFTIAGSSCPVGTFLCDRRPSGDLGNPDRWSWATRTRQLLDSSATDRNLIIWSWCGQVSNATAADIENAYLNQMAQLEIDYPAIQFVYMTGHLDGTSKQGNLHQRNEQIRAFVGQAGSNRVLFDFADIESYDPDGNYYLDKRANDECNYYDGTVRRNWAAQWCQANSTECLSCSSCAHSHCLNCQLKGKAFWWMMARLAGWPGVEQPLLPASPQNLRRSAAE